jgi:hypothetical protein
MITSRLFIGILLVERPRSEADLEDEFSDGRLLSPLAGDGRGYSLLAPPGPSGL